MERKQLQTISYLPSEELPGWWGRALDAKEFRRLKKVGMNCGMEYTSFPLFEGILPYSRYTHSVGVGEIVWHFTHDPKQALAGLYHDIATPCFAHVIDFVNRDYLQQESTEEGTSKIIAKSKDIQELLGFLGLSTSDIDNYHDYPIADNDSPRLSADRLEYTLSNAMNLLKRGMDDIQELYDAISVLPSGELGFLDRNKAKSFASAALSLGGIYSCDEDRYSMERLASIIRDALSCGAFQEKDLFGTEPALLRKLAASPLANRWTSFRLTSWLSKSPVPKDGFIQVKAKKRYIDPLVGDRRLSEIDAGFKAQVDGYLADDFGVYLKNGD